MAVGDRLQIADKPTLDEINTTIGDTGDTGGSTVAGTVMAKLNEILEQLGISTTGNTVQEVLEELLNQPKIIRHIQRGTYKTTGAQQYSIGLTGFTNVDKMIVLLNGGSRAPGEPGLYSLTTTTLVVSNIYQPDNYIGGSYQVIEFA